MDSDSSILSRLPWALSMGIIVVAAAAVLVVMDQSRQSTAVQPTSGNVAETTPISNFSTETGPPLTPTHTQLGTDVPAVTSMPDTIGIDGPADANGVGDFDFERDCMQVTTVPDCDEHAATPVPETSVTSGPAPTAPMTSGPDKEAVECVVVTGSTTVAPQPGCYFNTTEPPEFPRTTESPPPSQTVTTAGSGATLDVCDTLQVSTTDPSCGP